MAVTAEQDILELIAAGTQESLTLEYKRCAALQNNEQSKNEISKDVSAFANSAGGTLIYGVIENNQLLQGLDSGFDPAGLLKREWLEQIIGSRIQPRIDGIVIRPINLSGPNAGRFALVVDVPQSHTAHQASDKKYYKRQNFTVVPMEDYEIRDVFNRAKTPVLSPSFRAPRVPHSGQMDFQRFRLTARLKNDGDVSARTIRLEIGMPQQLVEQQYAGLVVAEGRNRREGRDYPEYIYIIERDSIVFPQQELPLENWAVTLPTLLVDHNRYAAATSAGAELRWTVYADDMRRREGVITIFPDLLDF